MFTVIFNGHSRYTYVYVFKYHLNTQTYMYMLYMYVSVFKEWRIKPWYIVFSIPITLDINYSTNLKVKVEVS